MFGIEYPTALAALDDRQIFAITAVDGGFEIREKAKDEYFVRLLPEQLIELGKEIIVMATAALVPAPGAVAVPPPVVNAAQAPVQPSAARKPHTITIPAGIWDARVTEQFQARIANLEKAEFTTPAPAKPPQTWIKP